MVRKIFSIVAAVSSIALLASVVSPRGSAATQTVTPDLTLNITGIELLGVNSLIVSWVVK